MITASRKISTREILTDCIGSIQKFDGENIDILDNLYLAICYTIRKILKGKILMDY